MGNFSQIESSLCCLEVVGGNIDLSLSGNAQDQKLIAHVQGGICEQRVRLQRPADRYLLQQPQTRLLQRQSQASQRHVSTQLGRLSGQVSSV